jgi:Fur family ferric uptake transcriptional regulator
MTNQSTFQKTIRQRGFRVTPQRELILDAVRAGKGHSSPERVYVRVHKKAPSLNRATVYRTLEFLAEQQLITSTDLGQGSKVYEISDPEPHHHLVCSNCGQVEQINHKRIAKLFKELESEHGFSITTNHLALFGICRHCKKM